MRFAFVLLLALCACKKQAPASATLANAPETRGAPAAADPCAAMASLKDPDFVKRPQGAAPAGTTRIGVLSWQSYGPGERIDDKDTSPRQTLLKNAEELTCLVRAAAREGAKVVVTPELALVGYGTVEFKKPDEASKYALKRDDPILTAFRAVARELGIHVILGFVEDGPYNAAAILAPNGDLLAVHRKGNLTENEVGVFTAGGAEATTFDVPVLGKAGVAICADTYGEPQMAALKQANVATVFVSSAWSGYRENEKGERVEDPAGTPTEDSRGRYDYERLSAHIARRPPVPVVVANHVELKKEGDKRIPALNDVGVFGVAGGVRHDGNQNFLALVDVK